MLFLYVAKYDLGWDKLSWPAVSLISDMQGHPNCTKGAHGLFTAILLRSVHYVRVLLLVVVCILMVSLETCIGGHLQTKTKLQSLFVAWVDGYIWQLSLTLSCTSRSALCTNMGNFSTSISLTDFVSPSSSFITKQKVEYRLICSMLSLDYNYSVNKSWWLVRR